MIRLILEDKTTPQNINPAQSDFFVLLSEWEQYKKDLTPPNLRPISDLSTVDPETEVVTFRWPCADFEDDFLVDPHKSVNGLFGFLEPGSDFRDGKYKEINKPDPKTIAAIRQLSGALDISPTALLAALLGSGDIYPEGFWMPLQFKIAQEEEDDALLERCRPVEIEFEGRQWLVESAGFWRKDGPQPLGMGLEMGDKERQNIQKVGADLIRMANTIKVQTTTSHTWEKAENGDLKMDTGRILPGRWEPLLVGRTVLYGLVRKTRVYVALEGEKVVAMVADGTQRWRE